MTMIVKGRIEVDKGTAIADLKQVADALKGIGGSGSEASTGAAKLVDATNAVSASSRDAAQAARGQAAAVEQSGQQAGAAAGQALALSSATDQATNSLRAAGLAADETSKARARQQQSLAALVQQYDPLTAAQQRAQAALASLNDLERQGLATRDEVLVLSRNIGAEYDQTAQAIARSGVATRLNINATEEDTRAKIENINAAGRQRAGYQQLGFQLGDFTTQVAMGQNALLAFAVQSQQAVGALQLIGGDTDKAKGKLAAFASFMGGPYGVAIGVALPIIALLASHLLDAGDASDTAKTSTIDFTDTLTARTGAVDNFRAAVEQLNGSTRQLISTQALMIDSSLQFAANSIANVDRQISEQQRALAQSKANAPGPIASLFYDGYFNDREQAQIKKTIAELQGARRGFEQSAQEARVAQERRTAIESADPVTRQRGEIEREQARLTRERLDTQRRLSGAIDPLSGGRNVSEADYVREYAALEKRMAALNETSRGSTKGDSTRQAAAVTKAAREAERLLDFTANTEERVQRITEQFDAQPRLVDQVAKASRELDDIQAEVEKRLKGNPEQIAKFTAAINAARGPVEDTLLRPFREMEEAGDRQLEQMMLVVQGRESEAEALQRIQQYEERNGELTEEQRQGILAQVEAERELGRLIEDRGRKLSIYNASIDDTRAALEDILSGGSPQDFLKSMDQNFRQLQGRLLTEQLFGDALRELEDFASGRTSLKTQTEKLVEDLAKPGPVANKLADAMGEAADKISQAAQRIANPGTINTMPNSVPTGDGTLGKVDPVTGEIVAVAKKADDRAVLVRADPTTFDFIKRLYSEGFKNGLKPLEDIIGTKLFNGLGDIIGGAMAGRAVIGNIIGGGKTGQAVGAAVGAVAGPELMAAISGPFAIASEANKIIGDIFGFEGGPLGIFTGLLKSTKRGSATITSVDGNATSRGNSQERIQASLGLAGGVQEQLRQIAQEFDAEIGSFAVSIGQRGKDFRVDTSGQGRTKTKRGAIDFGQDEEAAVAFALRDAISDGAIKGLSAAIQKALNSNPDVDRAIKEALKVRDVEELLEGIGGKIQKEVRDFDRQADERLRIARDYGFDIVEIERINAEERSKIIEDILEDRVGALQDLLNDLVFGDLAEGTLSERRQRLLEEIGKAEADAAKGIDGAADRLADLNRRLIQLSRDAYGTAGNEYASDRAQAIASAERIIQIENDRIRGTQEAAAETNRQLATANQLSNEQNDILAEISAGIRSLVSLDGLNIAGGGGGNASIDLGSIMREVNLK
jgi:hypothetical protein